MTRDGDELPDGFEQPSLFELPAASRRPPRMAAQPAKPRYTRFMPKPRRLCDDCIRDIHVRGVEIAPLPSSVRWRRTHDGATALLCHRHKEERVDSDG